MDLPSYIRGHEGHKVPSHRHPHKTVLSILAALYYSYLQAVVYITKLEGLGKHQKQLIQMRPKKPQQIHFGREMWTQERNQFIRVIIRLFPHSELRVLPTIIQFLDELHKYHQEKRGEASSNEVRSSWEKGLREKQIETLQEGISQIHISTPFILPAFEYLGPQAGEDVPLLAERVVERALAQLDSKISLMDILRDPDLGLGLNIISQE